MQLKEYSKYIFVSLFILMFYLSYKVIENYIQSIVAAIVIAILFYPLYKWILKVVKKKYLAALIVIIFILFVAILPFAFILNSLIWQVGDTVDFVKNNFKDGINCKDDDSGLCSLYLALTDYFPEFDIKNAIADTGDWIIKKVSETIRMVTSGIFLFFVSLYIVFFLFVDGKSVIKIVKDALPMKEHHEQKIQKTILETTKAVVFGNIVTALTQGVIAALGYWLIGGFDNAILLGMLTAFFALVPGIGSAFVWLPASAYVLIVGLLDSSGSGIIRGIVLLGYGAMIVSTIDNLLKPKLIGNRANIHPVVVFLGVLGGLSFMGLVGLFVGPLILSLFIKFIELLRLERKNL